MSQKLSSKYFGRNLKNVISVLGISQVELSTKAGLTKAAISQIISSQREPSLSSVIAILNCIPIKFEKLCTNNKDLEIKL